VLSGEELRAVAERFGVGEEQVRRDHLVSHLLAALPVLAPDVVFFGGTALARTHLPGGRLSEDVDLYVASRGAAARVLSEGLPRALRREFPGLTWDPALDAVRQSEPALLRSPARLAVRVQLLDAAGYAAWPTEERDVEVRYSDVAPARLRVPTLAAFAGMKTWAWFDRRAVRHLYDLWALAGIGAIDGAAAAAFQRAVGWPPRADLFDAAPDEAVWRAALGHQTALLPSAAEAIATVRTAFADL
jgi:hypothetical protein